MIALEEMELPYRLERVDIRKGEQYSAEFLEISPNNRILQSWTLTDRMGSLSRFRIRSHLAVSRPKKRQVLSG